MAKVKQSIKSVAFRQEREHIWVELEELLSLIHAKGFDSLELEQQIRLPKLYSAAISTLSVARSISLDKDLLIYLENLCKRAYLEVYRPKEKPSILIKDFFFTTFPKTFRQNWRILLLTLAFFVCGFLIGIFLVYDDPTVLDSFFNSPFAENLNTFKHSDISNLMRNGFEADFERLAMSFMVLVILSLFTYLFGFLYGIPSLVLLFIQGLSLGGFMTSSINEGWSELFFFWLFAIQIPAQFSILASSMGGIIIGKTFFRKGHLPFLTTLNVNMREGMMLLFGGISFYLINSLWYEIFKQIISASQLINTLLLLYLFWIPYFLFSGNKRLIKKLIDVFL